MRPVRLSLAARHDLRAYRAWLRREAGADIAERWIDALLAWIDELRDFLDRGTPRPDLGAALRTRVFRRTVTIAYVVADGQATVLCLVARGRNLTADVLGNDF